MRVLSCFLALFLSVLPARAQQAFLFEAVQAADASDLVIHSATDIESIRPLIAAFQSENPSVRVIYREYQTNRLATAAGEACAGQGAVADLVMSSSIDQQIKLVNDGCARKLVSPVLRTLPDWAIWRNEAFAVSFEPAVIVYNRRLLPLHAVPSNRFELVDMLRESDVLKGKVGTYDIELSGVGYLLANQDAIQASTYGRLIEGLGRQDVQLFCCSADMIDGIVAGRLLLGYNVLGSYALQRARENPDLGIVLPSDYTLIMARAAYVPKGAANPVAAQAFLEFIFSPMGQRIMSQETLMLSPIHGEDVLPGLMGVEAASQTFRPIVLSPALMVGLDQTRRRQFLEQWRSSVVR